MQWRWRYTWKYRILGSSRSSQVGQDTHRCIWRRSGKHHIIWRKCRLNTNAAKLHFHIKSQCHFKIYCSNGINILLRAITVGDDTEWAPQPLNRCDTGVRASDPHIVEQGLSPFAPDSSHGIMSAVLNNIEHMVACVCTLSRDIVVLGCHDMRFRQRNTAANTHVYNMTSYVESDVI